MYTQWTGTNLFLFTFLVLISPYAFQMTLFTNQASKEWTYILSCSENQIPLASAMMSSRKALCLS